MARRARNLTAADQKAIMGLIDGWTGPLTWERLIDAVEKRLGSRYTRQALHRHSRLQHAFATRRLSLQGDAAPRAPTATQLLKDRVARLSAENKRLQAENDRLLEQFVRWAYNASTRRIDEATLDLPLPEVARASRRDDQEK